VLASVQNSASSSVSSVQCYSEVIHWTRIAIVYEVCMLMCMYNCFSLNTVLSGTDESNDAVLGDRFMGVVVGGGVFVMLPSHFTTDGCCNPGYSVETQSACNICPNDDKI